MDLTPATLNGLTLAIEHLEDSYERAIVRHECLNQDGATLENLGQKARTVTIRAYFWDDDAGSATYADHQELLDSLADPAADVLVHPVYGELTGMVEKITIRHDDRRRCAEADIVFVEEGRAPVTVTSAPEVLTAVESAVARSQEEQTVAVAALAEAAAGPAGAELCAQPLDPEQGIVSQFPQADPPQRRWLVQVESVISTLENTLVAVVTPVNDLISVAQYAANLPGRLLAAVNQAVSRVLTLAQTAAALPDTVLRSVQAQLATLENSCEGFQDLIHTAGATQSALYLAQRCQADEELRREYRTGEQTPAFSTTGRYVGGVALPALLTSTDLEAALARARTLLQEAIDRDRTQQSCKELAWLLLEHVSVTKLERERIIRVQPAYPLPLHLLCHHHGLPYQAAERVVSLNPELVNPNLVSGGVKIYAR